MDQLLLIERLFNIVEELKEMNGVPEEERLRDKNVQKTDATDPDKRVKPNLTSDEKRRTTEIATLFSKTFFEFQKKNTPDKQGETLIKNIQRKTQPPPLPEKGEPKNGGLGLFLAGLLALVGSVGLLIYGLVNGGPLMGIIKILSKIGIKGAIMILKTTVKGFIATIGKFLKLPIEILSKIGIDIKGIFSGMGKAVSGKAGKFLGKGVVGKMLLKFGKPLLGILKKVPLIGSIISIGFAVSRFMKGDIVGGVIDTLSALSGLLYLTGVGAPVAFAIGLGLDVLNAWLDVKTGNLGGKEGNAKKLDLLKPLGMKLLRSSPIIGMFMGLYDGYQAVKSGDILGGFTYMLRGLGNVVGITQLYDGFNMLKSMFGDKKADDGAPKSSGISWISKVKDWVKNKLKSLPLVLRKPLEWLGIIDGDGSCVGDDAVKVSDTQHGKFSDFVKCIWKTFDGIKDGIWDAFKYMKDGIWNGLKGIVGGIWDAFKSMKDGISENLFGGISDIFGTITGMVSNIYDSLKGVADNIINTFKTHLPKITNIIIEVLKSIGNYIKKLFTFSDSDNGMSDNEKLSKANAAGHKSWEGYRDSGWKYAAPNTDKNITITTDSNPASRLNDIAKLHFKYMGEMVSYNKAMYQVLLQIAKNGNGGSNVVVNAPKQSAPRQNSPTISSYGDNRSGYANSDYSFA